MIKAVLHPLVVKAVSDALLMKDDLMASIAIFVLKYVEKESDRVKMERHLARSRRKTCELQSASPISDPSDDDDIPSKQKTV